MVSNFSLILIVISVSSTQSNRTSEYSPRHLHLSIRYEDTMTVTWSTKKKPDLNYVEYGASPESLKRSQNVQRTDELVSKSRQKSTTQFIHEATLRDVVPGRSYYYRAVSARKASDPKTRWSKMYKFTIPQNGTEWPSGGPNIILYGDLGYENAMILPALQEEVLSEKYEALIHVGDIGYDLNTEGGVVGDKFMELIEPIAARIPYQVCPGNHELEFEKKYNDYKMRFRMPDKYDSMMYSWNLGPVHFVTFNTENYAYTPKYIQRQYEWLKNDLEAANKNRSKRPWLIVYAHTPFYCAGGHHICEKKDNPVRIGTKDPASPSLEDLFMKNGVDLALWGHEHSYQASFPMYNYKFYNGSQSHPYKNPKALVHIISGVAGSKYVQQKFNSSLPAWTRFRTVNFGYSRLKFKNNTHLKFEQIDVTGDNPKIGKIIDSFTLIREYHSAYNV